MKESDSNVQPMNRVALINMPWKSVFRGSLALGLIKRVLHTENSCTGKEPISLCCKRECISIEQTIIAAAGVIPLRV
jgi:hypothetical protein